MRFSSVKTAHAEALAFLGKRESRKVGHNTYMRREDGSVVIRFHSTDIIKIAPGRMVLNSGGYKTVTTKDRFNTHLPAGYGIFSLKGVWRIYTPKHGIDKSYVFEDGCTLLANNTIAGVGDERALLKLRASVHKYASEFTRLALAGELPAPSAGDCFYCQAQGFGGSDHIKSHVEEMYIVPSLLVNAARELKNGYLMNIVLPILWDPNITEEKRKEMISHQVSSFRDHITRTIRRYVGRHLGLSV